MSKLFGLRCAIHPEREAAVRCPSCARFFCRECVTEHKGRMICAHCVAQINAPPPEKRSAGAMWVLLSVGGFLFAWMLFYYLGMSLARIPFAFHGGA